MSNRKKRRVVVSFEPRPAAACPPGYITLRIYTEPKLSSANFQKFYNALQGALVQSKRLTVDSRFFTHEADQVILFNLIPLRGFWLLRPFGAVKSAWLVLTLRPRPNRPTAWATRVLAERVLRKLKLRVL